MDRWIDRALAAVQERGFLPALRQLRGRTILLYGAGGFGIEMLHHLRSAGLRPAAFLDQNAADIVQREGIPVYPAETAPFDRQESVVLFCIVMDKEQRRRVLAWLREIGYSSVLEGQALRVLLVQPDDGAKEADYYRTRRERIQSAQELFRDDLSRDTYRQVVFGHMTGDYSGCERLERPMREQYFPSDVPLAKGFRRFVDCGGYIGDTVKSLLDREGSLEACAVFEPDSRNYTAMAQNLEVVREKIGERLLFPCAVSGGAEQCRFAQGTGSGSLSTEGESVVQTVSLDLAIPDFRPTMIKMDIEGAELSALRGAERLIRKNRPDLAVCTYHAVNHVWDIPLLLDSWGLGYRFSLRSYNACTMETVLYASIQEEMP